jgi:hypothetical protein
MPWRVPVVGTCAAGARPVAEGEDEVTEVGEEWAADNRRGPHVPAEAGPDDGVIDAPTVRVAGGGRGVRLRRSILRRGRTGPGAVPSVDQFE